MNTSSTAALVIAAGLAATPAVRAQDPCPLSELAPVNNLAPVPDKCDTPNCLISFKGYQWWTSYQYWGCDPNNCPGFYNDSLKTSFAPNNAFVDDQGMHLQMQSQDLGAGQVVAGAEVVLMFNADGSEANLGYGDYLVTATIETAGSWAHLDPNNIVGFFTYQLIAAPTEANHNREMDFEITRWGGYHRASCPPQYDPRMCQGNAEFALQPTDLTQAPKNNLHRFTMKRGTKTKNVTFVLHWRGAHEPARFAEYDGAFTFATLPARPSYEWRTKADQDAFVPATQCERFHINLWNGNFAANMIPNPPPQALPQGLVVTNFDFRSAANRN